MKWPWQKPKASYREVANELAHATALAYQTDGQSPDAFDVTPIIKWLVCLDCFLFERIVNQYLREETKAGKLINAFAAALVHRPEVNMAIEEFQQTYNACWESFQAAWRAELDPNFKTSLGIKAPLAAAFAAKCGEYSLSTLIYVDHHIAAARKYLPQVLAPLLSSDALSFE